MSLDPYTYTQLKSKLNQKLSKEGLNKMASLLDAPQEKMRSALDLFKYMEDRSLLAADNVKLLTDLLQTPAVGHPNLLKKVENYNTRNIQEEITQVNMCLPPPDLVESVPEGALAAVGLTNYFWDAGQTLNLYFMDGEPTVQQKVLEVARTWLNYVNLEFQLVNDPANSDVRISFRPGGSWSYIGTMCSQIPHDKPTMNLGWLRKNTPDKEYNRVVLHEFGHLLGLVHEHQHPLAKIPWRIDVVERYYSGPPNNWTPDQIYRNILSPINERSQYSAFDRTSIMLYPIPKEFVYDISYATDFNTSLSEVDIKFIQSIYPAQGATEARLLKDLPQEKVAEIGKLLDPVDDWKPLADKYDIPKQLQNFIVQSGLPTAKIIDKITVLQPDATQEQFAQTLKEIKREDVANKLVY